jgi:carboxyl-terminal processing protease
MYIRVRTAVIALLAAVALGSGATYGYLRYEGDLLPAAAAIPLSRADRQEFGKIYETFTVLKTQYYQPIDDQSVLEGAISGMVGALDDPFSEYFDKQDAKQFQQDLSSSFVGIGAEVQMTDGKVVIVSPIKNSPAEKAGLRPNDIILKVDGKSLLGMSLNEAVSLIRGKKGTVAHLDIERAGVSGILHVSVMRNDIPLNTVQYQMLPRKIGVIQITQFNEDTGKEFANALDKLKSQGIRGLVIDLRQDPGGYLESCIEIANLVVPNKGKIVQVVKANGATQVYSSTMGAPEFPIVALIDGGSASASEILAAALHESGHYPLVGEKSFGKGTVQTIKDFPDGSSLKYTMAKWLTPDGNWIHKKGILPDYVVPMPEFYNDPPLSPETLLRPNMNDITVKVLQDMLTGLGYHPDRDDGYYSPATQRAVEAFQRDHHLAVTGMVDGVTANAIDQAVDAKKKSDDPQLAKAVSVLLSQIHP